MSTRTVALIMIAMLVIATGVVLAQGPYRGGRAATAPQAVQPGCPGPCGIGYGPGMGKRLTTALNLTADQQAQIRQIREDFLNSTKSTREELRVKMSEMVDLWSVDRPNAAQIKALAAQIDDLKVTLRNAGIDHAVQALNVLTPDQRAKLRGMVKDRPGCGLMLGFGMFGPWGMDGGLGKAGPGPGAGMRGGGMGPTGTGCPMTR